MDLSSPNAGGSSAEESGQPQPPPTEAATAGPPDVVPQKSVPPQASENAPSAPVTTDNTMPQNPETKPAEVSNPAMPQAPAELRSAAPEDPPVQQATLPDVVSSSATEAVKGPVSTGASIDLSVKTAESSPVRQNSQTASPAEPTPTKPEVAAVPLAQPTPTITTPAPAPSTVPAPPPPPVEPSTASPAQHSEDATSKVVQPMETQPSNVSAVRPMETQPSNVSAVRPMETQPLNVSAVQPMEAQPSNVSAVQPMETQPSNVSAVQPMETQPSNVSAVQPMETQPSNVSAVQPMETQPSNVSAYLPSSAIAPKASESITETSTPVVTEALKPERPAVKVTKPEPAVAESAKSEPSIAQVATPSEPMGTEPETLAKKPADSPVQPDPEPHEERVTVQSLPTAKNMEHTPTNVNQPQQVDNAAQESQTQLITMDTAASEAKDVPMRSEENVPQRPEENVQQLPKKNTPQHPEENVSQLPEKNTPKLPEENVPSLPGKNDPQHQEESAPQHPKENALQHPEENAMQCPEDAVPQLPEGNASPRPEKTASASQQSAAVAEPPKSQECKVSIATSKSPEEDKLQIADPKSDPKVATPSTEQSVASETGPKLQQGPVSLNQDDTRVQTVKPDPQPIEPKPSITRGSLIKYRPYEENFKEKDDTRKEENMATRKEPQTAEAENLSKVPTEPVSKTPNEPTKNPVAEAEKSLDSKLPTDAPPSMDDDSLSMDPTGDLREANKAASEEAMDVDDSAQATVAGCLISSEESTTDKPPLDFKPFSHYTKDGKLISKDEDLESSGERPATEGEPSASVSADAQSMSVDDSLPGVSEERSKSCPQPPGTSEFQGQFMDFLKCNDNATQHSFGGTVSGVHTPTDSNQGEAIVGSEVTAEGEVTPPGPDGTTTPKSGKQRRKRRTKAQMAADRAAAAAAAAANGDASNISPTDQASRSVRKRKTKEEMDETSKDGQASKTGDCTIPGESSGFPPEKLFEYQWPQVEKNSDWFFLQEHLSCFLLVKSFKRKYPDLERRSIGITERNFLQESGVVSEMQCDLGLTALRSDQVYELMMKDFPEKYQQYAEVLHEREQLRRKEAKNRQADMAKMDKANVLDAVQKAVRSAAEFNAQFMRERREERRAYFDLQTTEIHYPKSKIKVLPKELTKVGAYPVALIPGQYSEYYKRYTPQQMKYFPLNTCMYDPPRHLKTIYADPADKYESELDSQSASSRDGSSSSGSSSSGSDSDSSSDEDEADAPKPAPPPPPPVSTKKQPSRTPRAKKFVRPTPPPASKEAANILCNICQGTAEKNKIGETEELVKCSECGRHGHPSCLELTQEMIPNIKTYPWQCMECKTCVECMDPYDEDKMMFCDHCDRGYHTFCVGLRSIPTGRWECPSCRPGPPVKKRRRGPNQNQQAQQTPVAAATT